MDQFQKTSPTSSISFPRWKKEKNTASITQKIAHIKSVDSKWLYNVLRTLPHYFLDNLFISIVRRDGCWRLLLTRCTMLVCCLRDSLRGRQLYVCHSILYRFQHHRHTSIVYISVALSKVYVRQTTVWFYFWAMTNITCACICLCGMCSIEKLICANFLLSLRIQECSIFIFEKRCAEKLHKPKRKETVTEILRNSIKQLERFRHPKVIMIWAHDFHMEWFIRTWQF